MSPRTKVGRSRVRPSRQCRSRALRCAARANMGADRSMPTIDTPFRASGDDSRPVPQPNSRTRPRTLHRPCAARTPRRDDRRCARSPNRRRARTRPSPASRHYSYSRGPTPATVPSRLMPLGAHRPTIRSCADSAGPTPPTVPSRLTLDPLIRLGRLVPLSP